ncbi:MAG: tyrosine-type recombinase/integrase [Hyphomonas sp.]
MTKITKRSIDATRPKAKETFVWDSELRGFGVRISPRGRRTFILQYRQGGRTRRMTLGPYGTLTPDEARSLARQNLGNIASGGDPSGQRQKDRRAPTVSALCDRFIIEHVELRCKPTTQREYRRCCDLFIKPAIGTMRVQDVTRADISDLHVKLAGRAYQANRVLGVLSKMFNLAEVWGLRDDYSNPTRHVKKYAERKRERFLSPEEIGALWSTLDRRVAIGEETEHVAAAFKLLLLTGCRLSEIQFLKWSYIRDDTIYLPDAKTGPRRVPLSPRAHALLRQIDRLPDNPFVIIGVVPGQAITDLQRPWRRIRKEAGIDDVRIHDLRHTFASIAAMAGQSLYTIGKLIGHTQVQSTARYAHLADRTTRKALNEVDGLFGEFVGYDDFPIPPPPLLKAANDG